jgi:hypothetical protein
MENEKPTTDNETMSPTHCSVSHCRFEIVHSAARAATAASGISSRRTTIAMSGQ